MFKECLQQGALYDAIFIKLFMPGMSGFDAVQEFRKLEKKFGLGPDHSHFICGTSAEVSERKYIPNLIIYRIEAEVQRE